MSTSSLIFSDRSASRLSADRCFGGAAFGGAGLAAGRVRAALQAWVERRAHRRAALDLDDRTLADIGLSRDQITFWRP